MTDLDPITEFRDAWVNGVTGRTGTNYGSTDGVHVKSGERRGLVRPQLVSLLGRTVVEARLIGRAAAPMVAQTFTLAPLAERFTSGGATWANQPGITAAAVVTEAVGALAAGDEVEFLVTDHIQAVADGNPWHGWRLSTSSSTAGQRFRSADSGDLAWELHVTLSDVPEVPDNLRPDGGAVVTSVPILAWEYVDLGGDLTDQAQARIQVDTPTGGADPDEVAPDFDSGWLTNTEPQFDLDASAHTPAGAGPHYWRVNVKDGDDGESGWSDWAEYTVTALPNLVVDSPVGAFGDPTPQLLAHLSSGTIRSWKAFVTGPDRADVRAETGLRTGTIDWTVPEKNEHGKRVLREDEAGWIYLRVRDSIDRALAVGQKAFRDVWIPVDWDEDLGVTAPTGLTVTPIADGDPRRLWEWSCAEAPDAWVIQVDGVTIARLTDEVTVDAGVYSWTDNGQVAPYRPHQLRVRAVEDGQRSTPATHNDVGTPAEGVWVLPEADGIDPIVFDGNSIGGFARNDFRATYVNSEGEEIDILYGTPPRTGTFEGWIDSRQDVWEALDNVELLRRSRNRMAQIVWGSQSVRARVRDPDGTPADDFLEENQRHVARFGFVQVDS